MNSDESIRSAERMLRAFRHSWGAIERAAQVDSDGVYVVRRSAAKVDGEATGRSDDRS